MTRQPGWATRQSCRAQGARSGHASPGYSLCLYILTPQQIEQPPDAADGRRETKKGAEQKVHRGYQGGRVPLIGEEPTIFFGAMKEAAFGR